MRAETILLYLLLVIVLVGVGVFYKSLKDASKDGDKKKVTFNSSKLLLLQITSVASWIGVVSFWILPFLLIITPQKAKLSLANRGMFVFTLIVVILLAAAQIVGALGLGFLTSGVFRSNKSNTDKKENTFTVSNVGYNSMKLTNLTQIISFALILIATVVGLVTNAVAIRRPL